jgi:adenine-specific DNA-methyltransferase
MPSALDTLIGRIADEQLRDDIRAAVSDLRKVTDFGLVFEAHIPETVRLPHHSIRRGIKVTLRDLADQSMFEVVSVNKTTATIRRLRRPDGSAMSREHEAEVQHEKVALSSVVALAEFSDAIYPGMRHLESVQRAGDKAAHVVINGENHHVLEALQFTHAGKIDCIYIDPPYNSGARDWKYNNNYVDEDDGYRHSKWLAFMNRRLQLARQLLNPDESTLIVTIDEKEVHRLGLLIGQIFRGAKTQMVTMVTNQRGVARGQEFARVDEYAIVVFVGTAKVIQQPDDMLTSEDTLARQRIDIWNRLMRRGTDSRRQDSPKQFYPIFIDPTRKAIVSVGDALPLEEDRRAVPTPAGLVAVWPIRTDGSEGRWTLGNKTLERYVTEGKAKVGAYNKRRDSWSISYLIAKDIKRIDSGEITVTGKDANGVLQLELSEDVKRLKLPRTVWFRDAHNAGTYGSDLLSKFLPGRRFPFPKSLYAVEDMLRFFVKDKPTAMVLDFFAGSGTTAHAVMRLNRQDGGRRQSISVTNNEVSDAEARELQRSGHQPGSPEWEALGIFEYVTRPRVIAAVTGQTSEGSAIAGEYKFVDEFPMAEGFDENVEFFELAYLDAAQIEVDHAFAGIAPLLWLRAGGRGPIVDACRDAAGRRKPYVWTEQYGILFKTDRWRSFVSKRPDTASTVYIVTDSITEFSQIAGELPGQLDVVRLYERYLTTFTVNGR